MYGFVTTVYLRQGASQAYTGMGCIFLSEPAGEIFFGKFVSGTRLKVPGLEHNPFGNCILSVSK